MRQTASFSSTKENEQPQKEIHIDDLNGKFNYFTEHKRDSESQVSIPGEENNKIFTIYENYKEHHRLSDQTDHWLTTDATIKNNHSFSSNVKSPARRYKGGSTGNTTLTATKSQSSAKQVNVKDKNPLYDRIIGKILLKDSDENPTTSAFQGSKLDSPRSVKANLNSLRSPSVPSRRNSSYGNLKKMNLLETNNFEKQTRGGLGVIKSTLDDTLQEKEHLKDVVEKLKLAIKQEKDQQMEHEKHQTVLKNEAYKLCVQTESLDKHITGSDVQVKHLQQDIQALEEEIENYKRGLDMVVQRIAEEKEMVLFYTDENKAMKLHLADETKQRDHMRDMNTNSKRGVQRNQGIYETLEKDKKAFLLEIEKNFRMYGN
jgi:hypothetical protein